MEWLFYLGLGGFVGFMAGLLGIGGGLIMVPLLLELWTSQGMTVDLAAKLAVGTSLATIVVTGMSSTLAHHRHGAVQWGVWRQLMPGVVVGAVLGAVLARIIEGLWLAYLVGIFALLAGIKMGLQWKPKGQALALSRPVMVLIGGGIGSISSLIGIGGGTLTVPFLVWSRLAMPQAIATSAAVGLPIGVVGALSFMVVGWGDSRVPSGSLGWVYMPAAACVALTSVLFAPKGAALVHRLPVGLIKRIFSVLLLIIGTRLLLR